MPVPSLLEQRPTEVLELLLPDGLTPGLFQTRPSSKAPQLLDEAEGEAGPRLAGGPNPPRSISPAVCEEAAALWSGRFASKVFHARASSSY